MTADPTTVLLICLFWHRHLRTLTAEQVMALRLDNRPEDLISLPVWVRGGGRLRDVWLNPSQCRTGFVVSADGVPYVFDSVSPDLDRIWFRPGWWD